MGLLPDGDPDLEPTMFADVAEDSAEDDAATGASAMEAEVMFSHCWISMLYTVFIYCDQVVEAEGLAQTLR